MTVDGIDHVHVLVSDREASIAWYGRTLGLRPDSRFATWAHRAAGPIVLCTEAGRTVLSLFVRPGVEQAQDATIAFGMAGGAFVRFMEALPALALQHHGGRILSASNLIDHELSFSIYFLDPDRNRVEVTTYDREAVVQALRR